MKCILGLDPGLASTGYGLITIVRGSPRYVKHGVIKTASDWPAGRRLAVIYDAVSLLVDEFKPEMAGVESLYFAKNRTSAIPVAQAKGILLLVLEQKGVSVAEFSPPEIKQGLTGSGRAEKEQVWEMVRIVLGLAELPGPDHATDALAAAICCYHNKPAFSKGLKAGGGFLEQARRRGQTGGKDYVE